MRSANCKKKKRSKSPHLTTDAACDGPQPELPRANPNVQHQNSLQQESGDELRLSDLYSCAVHFKAQMRGTETRGMMRYVGRYLRVLTFPNNCRAIS